MQSQTLAGSVKGPRLIAALIDFFILRSLAAGVGMLSLLYPISTGAIERNALTDQRLELFISPIKIAEILRDAEQWELMLVVSLVMLAIGFIYFSYTPYKMNGQTLGKKIMKIKAVNEEYENPTLLKHILRSVINYDIYLLTLGLPLVMLAYLFTFSAVVMFVAMGFLINITTRSSNLALIVSAVMVLFRADARGLHDMIAGTMVVPENNPLEEKQI